MNELLETERAYVEELLCVLQVIILTANYKQADGKTEIEAHVRRHE